MDITQQAPGRKLIPLVDRIWTHVDATGDCWEWTAATRRGYGKVTDDTKRSRQAHVVVYELLVGPIPSGLQLDHLCRNRLCVNPDHLEPVSAWRNTSRSPTSITAVYARRTACSQGHAYTPENTWMDGVARRCRACARRYKAEARAKRKAAM